MTVKPTVEFENERVRVIRVKQSGGGAAAPETRHDRLVVYLKDSSIIRHQGGRRETLHRRAGEVIWRDRSQHQIEVTQKGEHEVLIIELKS